MANVSSLNQYYEDDYIENFQKIPKKTHTKNKRKAKGKKPFHRKKTFSKNAFQLASDYFNKGKYRESKEILLQNVSTENNANIHLWDLLIQCFIRLGQFENAKRTAQKRIIINDDDLARMNFQFIARAQHDEIEKENNAWDYYKSHTNETSFKELAMSLIHRKKLDLANKVSKEFLEKNENSYIAVVMSAKILIKLGNFSESEQLLEKYIDKFETPMTFKLLMRSYRGLGRNQKAEILYERYLLQLESGKKFNSKTSEEKNMLNYYAEILRKEKRYEESIKIITNYELTEYPSVVCKAYCNMHLQRYVEAHQNFKLAETLVNKINYKMNYNPYFRIKAGLIFLFDSILNGKSNIVINFLIEIENAAHWIMKLEIDEVGKFQKRDLIRAQTIIQESGIIR